MTDAPRIYYQDRDCTLWLGDCRDVLPRLGPGSVDLILTDPPYGVNWQATSGRTRMDFGPIANDDGAFPLLQTIGAALTCLRKHRHLYVFGIPDFGDLPIVGRAELIWDKEIVGPGDVGAPWGPQHERILFGVLETSKHHRENGSVGSLSARLRRGSVLRAARANGVGVTVHPTEKPVSILREMIEASTLHGETVLDPFAGSGSTGVAAKLEGRRSILIELEERYCAVAARRLAQQVLPLEVVA